MQYQYRLLMIAGLLGIAAEGLSFGTVSELEVTTPQPVQRSYLELRIVARAYDDIWISESRVTGDRIQIALDSRAISVVGIPPPPGPRRWDIVVYGAPAHAREIEIYREEIQPDQLESSVPVEIAPGPYPLTTGHVTLWPPDPGLYFQPHNQVASDPVWALVEPPNPCQGLEAVLSSGPHVFETAPDCAAHPLPMRVAIPLMVPSAVPAPIEVVQQAEDMYYRIAALGFRPHEEALRARRLQVPLSTSTLPPRLAGSWYDPTQSGQGINLEIHDGGEALVYWYTFDTAGNPAWIVAQGEHDVSGATLEAYVVEGGVFPPMMDPARIEQIAWGEIELAFTACNEGHMQWTTDRPGFTSGAMPLTRLTGHDGHACGRPPPDAILMPEWYSSAHLLVVLTEEAQ